MQSKIFLPNRSIVTPGDLIAEGEFQIPWSPYYFKVGQKYYSTVIGILEVNDNIFEIIPLESTNYYPRVGDIVIGLVEDIEIYGWIVDIKAPYSAYLPAISLLGRPANPGEDLRRYLDRGDYIIAKIEAFDRTINPILTVKGKGLGRISSGAIVDILPVKVPRVIGKNKSMLETLMSETSCSINVAQNGRIWIECPSAEKEELLISAIRIIEKESHQKGLTERIKKFLREGSLGEKNGSNTKT
ncbi:MAG: exosome complex RNA-binding protein Rrp4 [Sulfolobales archaeon]